MNHNDCLNEFLGKLISCANNKYKTTREWEYRKQCNEEAELLLESGLTPDERELVDEILEGINEAAEKDAGNMYRQGMLDCVWLLKSLKVLA